MTYADIIMLDNKVKYDNDVDAMLALGRAYAAGDGVARNKNTALEWLRKAALAGKAEALAEIEKLTAGSAPAPSAQVEKTSTASPEEAPAGVVKESQARKTAVGWKKFYGWLAAVCAAVIAFFTLTHTDDLYAASVMFSAVGGENVSLQGVCLILALFIGLDGFLSFISCNDHKVSHIVNWILIILCGMSVAGWFDILNEIDSSFLLALLRDPDTARLMQFGKTALLMFIAMDLCSCIAAITVLYADYTAGKK